MINRRINRLIMGALPGDKKLRMENIKVEYCEEQEKKKKTGEERKKPNEQRVGIFED